MGGYCAWLRRILFADRQVSGQVLALPLGVVVMTDGLIEMGTA